MNFQRVGWVALVPLMTISAIMLPGASCADDVADAQGAVCCKEFQVGGTITADVGTSAQATVAAQAVADLTGVASVVVTDLTTVCRNIAQELDAPKADQTAADAQPTARQKMQAWCSLAVAQIGVVKGSAQLSMTFTPPKCEASVSAKANCQASCSGSASCDIKANPPTCEGGSLEVACKGSCTAKAGASLNCTGQCTGNCSGECTASGGVQCAGKCDGDCSVATSGGVCNGTCTGTCHATAPNAQCSGTCKGTCSASCQGSAEASVKCDGECSAEYEPLKCTGGELKGGCQVDAKCEGNCDASVKAKAECTPPQVSITFSGTADAKLNKLKAVLEANLGVVIGAKAKVEAMAKVAGTLQANVSGFAEIKPSCLIMVVAAVGDAVKDVEASGSATLSVTGSIN